jgi:hypothetical protein
MPRRFAEVLRKDRRNREFWNMVSGSGAQFSDSRLQKTHRRKREGEEFRFS